MERTNRRTSAWPSLAVLLAVLLSAMQPAIADDTLEREQLAALARRLSRHSSAGWLGGIRHWQRSWAAGGKIVLRKQPKSALAKPVENT